MGSKCESKYLVICNRYKWLESHYAENQFGFSEFQKDYDLVNLQNTVAISKR